jgi:uncharacterized membrane protein
MNTERQEQAKTFHLDPISNPGGRRLRIELASVTICLLFLLPIAHALDPRQVSVLYIGDPVWGYTPFHPMNEDAFVVVAPISAYHHGGYAVQMSDIRRYVRMYMPRNYEQYTSTYDVVVFSNAYRTAFGSEQHRWFRDGVIREGMGALMAAGQDSFAASSSRPDANWRGSMLEEALPVKIPGAPAVIQHNWIRKHTMEVVDYDHPFIASLPFEPVPLFMKVPVDGQLVALKQEAHQLAHWKYPELGNPPLYAFWTIGEGRAFAISHEWTLLSSQGGGRVFAQWEYFGDFAINLMLYLADRALPPDYLVTHQYREQMHTIALGRSMLLALIDFVDKFSGNTVPIDRELADLDDLVSGAEESYLDHEFDAALSESRLISERLKEIERLSVRMKNQALIWVYAVEWLSVSAVSLISGVLIWGLMVRRRLYREVSSTRLTQSNGQSEDRQGP